MFFSSLDNYLAKSSTTLSFKAAPLNPCAAIFPEASSTKVAGMASTLYCFAIGSSQNFKFETCVHVKPSFAIASFQAFADLSKETPMIFNPFACNSLYKATIFGFSLRHGGHHDAQKSTMVTFPKLCFKLITFPCGFGAEKSALHFAEPGAAGVAPTEGAFISVKRALIALPGLVFFNDSSKLSYNFSAFLTSVDGSFNIP